MSPLCLPMKFLPSRVDLLDSLNDLTPSLHAHYRHFIATISQSAPVFCIGTLILVGSPLESLPSHQNDRFTRSTQEPALGSRLLYAGCHPSGKEKISLGFVLKQWRPSVSTSSLHVSTSHQRFTCVRLPSSHLTHSCAFSFNAHYPGSLPAQLKAVWQLTSPTVRHRRAYLHLLCDFVSHRHLYAGRHSSSNQVALELVPARPLTLRF